MTYRVDGGPALPVHRNLGRIRPGTTVEVSFTVRQGCSGLTVSLAAYEAPAAQFDPATAPAQRLLDSDSRTFGPGPGSLQVSVPDCYYQVDLVRGPVLPQLGPAGTTNYYSAQRRLVAYGNGGNACGPTPPVTPTPTPVPAVLPPPPVIPELPTPSPSVTLSPGVSPSPSVSPTSSPAPSGSATPGGGGGGGGSEQPATGGGGGGQFLPFTGLALTSLLALVCLLIPTGTWLVVANRRRIRFRGF